MEDPCYITGDHEALTSLEAQIAELADEAEYKVDLESRNIVLPENEKKQRRAFVNLYSLVKEVVGRIDSTMKKWMAIQNKLKNFQDHKAQDLSFVSTSRHGLESENKMVGLEKEFVMMQDQLARGARELEVVSIVGMGGIGKTTLANKIYCDPFIMSHFDIRAKATVSQEYCARNVLLGLLSSISGKINEFHEPQDDDQLADRLQKLLKCGRYLIVIDDIWTREAWDDIKRCFPDCNNESRILMTTRNVEVAEYANSGLLRFTRQKRRAILLERPSWNLPPIETFPYSILPRPGAFPQNLKKLAFYGTCLQWEDLSIVGKLPKLEALKLGINACIGDEWKIVKDGFPCLKFLLLEHLMVRYWRASCDHFPCLERLFLEDCWYLDSIPQDFADITTLALIDIRWCEKSVENSAKQIQEDILNNYASFVEVNIHEPQ